MNDKRLLPAATPQQLVLFMHGVGANGDDLISLGNLWRPLLPQAVFVSPDAFEPYDMAPFGRQWFSLRDRSAAAMKAGIEKAKPAFDAYLKKITAEFNLPFSKTVLVGFSQGTMMALYAGLQQSEKLAGILGYSGALLDAENMPALIKSKPPVCLVHGLEDDVVPAAASRMAASVLEKAGVATALHLCPNLGHGIDDKALGIGAAFLQRTLI